MPASITFYNSFKKKVQDGTNIDMDTNTIKVALCTSTYTPVIDTHDFFDDITNEVSDADYTAGGVTITTPALTQVDASDLVKFTADTVSWTSLTITNCRYGIIYKSTGTASTSPLIAYIDFGTNLTGTDVTLTITWNASGVYTLA